MERKTRWKDLCKRYMESVQLKVEDILDSTKWKIDIFKTILATQDCGKSLKRRRSQMMYTKILNKFIIT